MDGLIGMGDVVQPPPMAAAAATRPKNLWNAVLYGAVAAAIYFAAVSIAFAGWVHYYYAGNYSGPLKISMLFGVSDSSLRAGARPIHGKSNGGWDGQFYYTQSNDPFLQNDYRDGKLFDVVSYRYTRNGLPIMARAASLVAGQSLTTPLIYFTTQFLFTAVGFGLLVAWLIYHSQPWYWALVWGLYGGVLRPMLHGLPDPTGDALFLVAILATLDGRLWIYAIAASLLCLCRESYAAPAAVLWALTVAGKVDWRRRWSYPTQVVATTVPGVVVLGWAAYVAHQLDTELLAGSRSMPSGFLVDWPFKAYVQCLWADLSSPTAHGEPKDVFYTTSCVACLIAVFGVVAMKARKAAHYIPLLPHILLMSMTGYIVWGDGTGYLKNAGSVVLLGVMLLPATKSKFLRVALLCTFVSGLCSTYKHEWEDLEFSPPLEHSLVSLLSSNIGVVPVPPPAAYGSKLEVIGRECDEDEYNGIFEPWHRSPGSIIVRISNCSSVDWPMTLPGDQAISLGTKYFEDGKPVREDRLPLHKPVPVGESIDLRIPVPFDAENGVTNTVSVSMVHDGRRWFSQDDASQSVEVGY